MSKVRLTFFSTPRMYKRLSLLGSLCPGPGWTVHRTCPVPADAGVMVVSNVLPTSSAAVAPAAAHARRRNIDFPPVPDKGHTTEPATANMRDRHKGPYRKGT